MRSRVAGLFAVLALTAIALPVAAQPDSLIARSPAAVGDTSRVHSASRLAVRAAIDTVTVPASLPTSTSRVAAIEMIALGGIIGATKKTTRRSTGKRRDVPMYVDSILHVQRKNDDTGKHETVAIPAGVLVDDTDLTDDEIDEFTARRVIRPATVEEIERLDKKDAADERADLEASQTAELEQLRANHAAERAELVGKEGTSPAAIAKLDDKHATAVSQLQAKHAAALAKHDQQ